MLRILQCGHFLVGPMVKTLCLHCRECWFNSWSELDYMPRSVAKINNKLKTCDGYSTVKKKIKNLQSPWPILTLRKRSSLLKKIHNTHIDRHTGVCP